MEQCCKKMPKIINMKSVKECFKSLRPVPPPPENPGGPPPPTGSPSGPLPTGSPSGPPPPPPPGGALPPPGAEGDDEEFGENDAGEAVETLDAIAQNSPSGQLQHRPGGKACKGKCLAITSFNLPKKRQAPPPRSPAPHKLQFAEQYLYRTSLTSCITYNVTHHF